MGLLNPVRRFFRRMAESDEQRYAAEIAAWAAKVPGAVPIGEATPRSRVKLAGGGPPDHGPADRGFGVARGAPGRRHR